MRSVHTFCTVMDLPLLLWISPRPPCVTNHLLSTRQWAHLMSLKAKHDPWWRAPSPSKHMADGLAPSCLCSGSMWTPLARSMPQYLVNWGMSKDGWLLAATATGRDAPGMVLLTC